MDQCKDGQQKRTVLIAVDGSDNSNRAFQVYAQAIHRQGDHVLIIFVQDERPYEPWPESSNYHDEWESIMKFMKEQEDYVVKQYEDQCKNHEFDFEPVMIEVGSPGPVICDVAKSEKADLLVLGSRGKGTLRRTLMGSVSTYCVHHAHIPVLMVPHINRHKLHGYNNGGKAQTPSFKTN